MPPVTRDVVTSPKLCMTPMYDLDIMTVALLSKLQLSFVAFLFRIWVRRK